ncbi:haloacid dehalogenase [Alternaria rosae]|uniref:haloacid dehalogenase n=1 Tax=Alternaria rosae TaxID=1187941 RepID=UPI001E8EF25C|nr:haloacid dehalogenase [Alternaria rosae]KAH6858871.1 haloacid dehalogenase [Alternaria rosae]
MSPWKPMPQRKNLFLCLDAFGTLFTPSKPIPVSYAQAALRHGINIGNPNNPTQVSSSFKSAFKRLSSEHPNYGRATGMGAEKWWAKVIKETFTPFLSPNQAFPKYLVPELLHTYSSRKGYTMYPDVLPFFRMIRHMKTHQIRHGAHHGLWPWEKTIVGIITNSDDRVPGILSSFGVNMSPERYPGISDRRSGADVDAPGSKGEEYDIDFTVLSYDVGAEKPDRQIFAAAEDMLDKKLKGVSFGDGIKPGVEEFEKLYVGDDLYKDVFGAQDAGWSSVLLERDANALGGQGYGFKMEDKGEERGEAGEAIGQNRLVPHVGSLLDLCAWPRRPAQREVSPVRYVYIKGPEDVSSGQDKRRPRSQT